MDEVYWSAVRPRFAGVVPRLCAYLFDVVPIGMLVFAVFYLFLGFDETLERYQARVPGDDEGVARYYIQRNCMRFLVLVLYLGYSILAEASPWRGTHGKRMMGIEVLSADGEPLSLQQSARRGGAKILSFSAFGLGCLWALWDAEKRGWHDMIAGTRVFVRSGS